MYSYLCVGKNKALVFVCHRMCQCRKRYVRNKNVHWVCGTRLREHFVISGLAWLGLEATTLTVETRTMSLKKRGLPGYIFV